MKKIIIALMFLFLFASCSTLQVSVDYDQAYDLGHSKTFAVLHFNREGENTLFNDRVIKALEADLISKNYKKVSKENADMIFVFHVNVESKTDIHVDFQRVGYRRYGYGSGMITSTTHKYDYHEGTLIVDALNPKTEKIFWRGTAKDELTKRELPKAKTEYINKVINKLMSSFPR